jgi:putative transposase
MFRKQEHKNLCEHILQDVASRHNITINELSVMPDHIHAVVSIPPTMSISQAFHLLKGASARELFKQKPNFRKRYPRGHFWSPGKFYRSVGDADVETVVKYVQDQRLVQTTLDYASRGS